MVLGLLLLLTNCSFAAEPEIHVDAFDPRIKKEEFKKPSSEVNFHQSGKEHPGMEVLSQQKTEALLQQAQLSDEVRTWDQLAKDLLIIKARKLDTNSLAAEYPTIEKAKLIRLKGFLK